MGDLSKLITEIADDTERRGYAGMTDEQLYADLHLPRIAVKVPIQNRDIIGYAILREVLDDVLALEASATKRHRRVAILFKTQICDDPEGFTNPSMVAITDRQIPKTGTSILDELLSDVVDAVSEFTANDKAAVLAMGDRTISKVEQLYGEGSKESLGHVQEARRLANA